MAFSCLGHTYMHLFAVYFFLIALPLEQEWEMSYPDLIELWTVGAFLVGAMAMPAGWLADRWSPTGMMVVFFLGLGASSIVCGLAPSPTILWIGLCLLGTFAAIYHPVGIAWLVRSTESRGKALGFNGIFGNLGVSLAGVVVGGLTDVSGWRVAFIVPGAVSVLTGLAMLALRFAGAFDDAAERLKPAHVAGPRDDRYRAFAILMFTTFGSALVYQASQAAMPKLFASRLADIAGSSTLGIGAMVALVYGVAGLSQLAAGHLADTYDLKRVFVSTYALQVPLLWLAADLDGLGLLAVTTAMVVANIGSLPAESLLLAQTTPHTRHGLVFGVKFVLAFTAAPVAIKLVATVTDQTGSFRGVFVTLASVAAVMVVAAALLPIDRQQSHA